MKTLLFILPVLLFTHSGLAQESSSVFETISKAVKDYKLDTSEVPKDRITAKIVELRALKGGFNINEAIEFKIQEDLQKKEGSREELLKLSESFKNGLGRKWLDNAITWIYRKEFSYRDLKQLVKFYKTPAGQKMAKDFPVIMLQSLAAAETIQQILTRK